MNVEVLYGVIATLFGVILTLIGYTVSQNNKRVDLSETKIATLENSLNAIPIAILEMQNKISKEISHLQISFAKEYVRKEDMTDES